MKRDCAIATLLGSIGVLCCLLFPCWEWGLRYAWRFAGQVRVFSAYEDELRDGIEAIRTGKDVLYSGTFHIERMDGPFALEAWWINRFARLPNGCRMDIYCTLDAQEEGIIQP